MTAMVFGVAGILFVLVFAGLALHACFTGRPNALTRLAGRLCDSAAENSARYIVILGMIVCGIFYCKSMLG